MRNAEVERVRAVVWRYIDAARRADLETVKNCFHQDARVSGCWGERLVTGLAASSPEALRTAERPAGKAQLLSLSVTGRIADAVVYETGEPGEAGLEEHLQLIEDGEHWRIIAKSFTTI